MRDEIAKLLAAYWWGQWGKHRDDLDKSDISPDDLALADRIIEMVRKEIRA
jgi:hypothetical protein